MATEQLARRGNAVSLNTPRHPWILWRANATEDAAAKYNLATATLDKSDLFSALLTNRMFDAKDGLPPTVETDGIIDTFAAFGEGANGVEIMFFSNATDSANEYFDFEIFAWKSGLYGPAKRVFGSTSNSSLLGLAGCLKHPTLGTAQANGLWCDTIIGTSYWPGLTVTDNGNNQKAVLSFDLRGWRYLLLRIFNAAGTAECGTIGSIITAY